MENVTTVTRLKCAAGTAEVCAIVPPGVVSGLKWRLKGATLVHNAAVATNGTDYITAQLYKGASTAIATAKVTSSVGWTQYEAENFTLTGVGTDLEFSQSSAFSARIAHSGSGKAVDSNLVCEWEVVR